MASLGRGVRIEKVVYCADKVCQVNACYTIVIGALLRLSPCSTPFVHAPGSESVQFL